MIGLITGKIHMSGLLKQPSRGVPRKSRSENIQQIYRRNLQVALQLYGNHTSV